MEENREFNIVEEQQPELNNQEPKSKKSLVIICIVVGLIIFAIIGFVVGKNNSNSENSENPENLANADNLSADSVGFNCFLADESGNKADIMSSNIAYGKGDYLLCNIGISKRNYSINGITFDFVSDDVEVINISSAQDDLKITFDNQKDKTFVSITSENIIGYSDIGSINFHLYIKDNKSFEINLKDMNISNSGDKEDKYLKEKKITLNNDNVRYYKKDGSIIFEKVQSDGLFKKVNEYKCNDGSYTGCLISPASQSFAYVPANKNVIMLVDDNYSTMVMFDIDKGVIGTYGGSALYLYSSERKNNEGGTYIYIQAKNSDKYGIIDTNGKLVHEFNLNGAHNQSTEEYINGMLRTAYSVENDMIIEKKNGKFGISRIKSNDTVIEYSFDLIRLFVDSKYTDSSEITKANSKYFKAKINNQWYLYSFETKNKVINEGYDNLFLVNDEIVIVEKDNHLYIKDIKGNNLVNDKIEDLSSEYIEAPCCVANAGIEINVNNNIVTIKTYRDNYNIEDYNQYEYNISKKALTKIK